MKDFETRISGFFRAHVAYVQSALAQEFQPVAVNPVYFAFEGEHSVIADPAGGDVATKIQLVRRAMEETLAYRFRWAFRILFVLKSIRLLCELRPIRCDKGLMSPDGAVVGLFSCVYPLFIPHPRPPSSTPTLPPDEKHPHLSERSIPASQETASETKVIVRWLNGNIEIRVAWDRSHRYFPGVRTTVRFSLIG